MRGCCGGGGGGGLNVPRLRAATGTTAAATGAAAATARPLAPASADSHSSSFCDISRSAASNRSNAPTSWCAICSVCWATSSVLSALERSPSLRAPLAPTLSFERSGGCGKASEQPASLCHHRWGACAKEATCGCESGGRAVDGAGWMRVTATENIEQQFVHPSMEKGITLAHPQLPPMKHSFASTSR